MTIRQLRERLDNSLRYARLSDSVRIKREWNRAGLRDIAPDTAPDNAHAISAKRLLERAENAEKRFKISSFIAFSPPTDEHPDKLCANVPR